MRTTTATPARLTALVLALAAAACQDDPAGPLADELDAAEAEMLALDLDQSSGDAIDGEITALGTAGGEIGTLDTRTVEIEFTVTRSCPAGGEVRVEGTMIRQRDTDERTLTVDLEATRTMTACAHDGPHGTITTDGAVTVTAHRMRVSGAPTGPQTTTHEGSITWTRESGESRTCEIDLTSVRDPQARSRTVTGTFCGREISKTVTWRVDG